MRIHYYWKIDISNDNDRNGSKYHWCFRDSRSKEMLIDFPYLEEFRWKEKKVLQLFQFSMFLFQTSNIDNSDIFSRIHYFMILESELWDFILTIAWYFILITSEIICYLIDILRRESLDQFSWFLCFIFSQKNHQRTVF